MAQPQQAPVGGLNQARPAPAPAQQAPAKPDNLAVRASGMEQESPAQPEDFLTKSLRDLQAQREALNATAQRLKSSLDTRMGLPFDPVMMAAASGFLKPTKTGGFGESLGYAAEGMSSEAEKQFARQQAANKMEMELQQKILDMTQQGALMGHRMTRLGIGMPGGARATPEPAAGPAGGPAGGPVGGPAGGPAAPSGAPTAISMSPTGGRAPVTSTGAPRQMPLITDRDIEEAYLVDPSGKYGKELEAIAKMQREDKVVTPEGIFNRSTDTLVPFQDKIVEVDFGKYVGVKKVPYSMYKQWEQIHNRAVEEGNPNLEIDWFKRRGWVEGKPSTPTKPGEAPAGGAAGAEGKPAEGKEPDRPLTLSEQKARDELRAERAKAQVGQEKEQIGRIDTNFTQSRELINSARGMKELATSNKRAFDLMNDDGVATAVMRAAKQGLQAGNLGSISIPTDTVYQGVKLSKEDREALQLFARDYANLTVAFRKAARVPGEGTTTEREGDLYASLGALPTDTAKVIRLKSEFIEMKGKYDQEVFKAWSKFSKNPDNSYRDFLASEEFSRINDAYDRRLGEIQRANADLLKPRAQEPKPAKPAAAPTARPQPASQPAAQPSTSGPPRIKGRTDPVFKNLPVGGVYIDSDGTVRRKKEGE